jgi:hypothetical protein
LLVFLSNYFVGRFVNREPIGKGKIRPLVNNDRITFSRPDLGGFKLIIQQNDDDDEKSNLPKDVTSKYIVGKMKGSGVTGNDFVLNNGVRSLFFN